MIDDETHRMNYCEKYQETNFFHSQEKVDFNMIFSSDINDLRNIIPKISQVWNTKNAHGTMN